MNAGPVLGSTSEQAMICVTELPTHHLLSLRNWKVELFHFHSKVCFGNFIVTTCLEIISGTELSL